MPPARPEDFETVAPRRRRGVRSSPASGRRIRITIGQSRRRSQLPEPGQGRRIPQVQISRIVPLQDLPHFEAVGHIGILRKIRSQGRVGIPPEDVPMIARQDGTLPVLGPDGPPMPRHAFGHGRKTVVDPIAKTTIHGSLTGRGNRVELLVGASPSPIQGPDITVPVGQPGAKMSLRIRRIIGPAVIGQQIGGIQGFPAKSPIKKPGIVADLPDPSADESSRACHDNGVIDARPTFARSQNAGQNGLPGRIAHGNVRIHGVKPVGIIGKTAVVPISHPEHEGKACRGNLFGLVSKPSETNPAMPPGIGLPPPVARFVEPGKLEIPSGTGLAIGLEHIARRIRPARGGPDPNGAIQIPYPEPIGPGSLPGKENLRLVLVGYP